MKLPTKNIKIYSQKIFYTKIIKRYIFIKEFNKLIKQYNLHCKIL